MNKKNNNHQSDCCRICKSPFSESLIVREMMFGFRDSFTYHQCSNCACLQIDVIPENIDKYYPPYYYSFTDETAKLKRQPFIKRLVGNLRLKSYSEKTEQP